LFVDGGDVVSIHTLASAANAILKDICRKKNAPDSFDAEIVRIVRPEKVKEFHRIMNRHANFFKHADTDADGIVEDFKEEQNDGLLLRCLWNYRAAGFPYSPAMGGFTTWFNIFHYELLKDESPIKPHFAKLNGMIGEVGRTEKLQIGKFIHAAAKGDQSTMNGMLGDMKHRYPNLMKNFASIAWEIGRIAEEYKAKYGTEDMSGF
jgi:hypothetical protein